VYYFDERELDIETNFEHQLDVQQRFFVSVVYVMIWYSLGIRLTAL